MHPFLIWWGTTASDLQCLQVNGFFRILTDFLPLIRTQCFFIWKAKLHAWLGKLIAFWLIFPNLGYPTSWMDEHKQAKPGAVQVAWLRWALHMLTSVHFTCTRSAKCCIRKSNWFCSETVLIIHAWGWRFWTSFWELCLSFGILKPPTHSSP